MSKTSFINELCGRTGLSAEQAETVNEVFEENFVFRKKNEEKIRVRLSERLGVDEARAKEIYDAGLDIIDVGIIGKIKRPFGGRE